MSSQIIKTGEKPGDGTYYCTNCGQEVSVGDYDKMPPCPRCSNNEFTSYKKDSYSSETLS